VVEQRTTSFNIAKSQEPPYPGMAGRWGRWIWGEVDRHIPRCYDLIYDSQELDKLSAQRGYDVREKIENDFLKATIEYLRTVPNHVNNVAPKYMRSVIGTGQVINEPEYVHWAVHWLTEILRAGCFYDGLWRESPSYHYMTMGGLRASLAGVAGYSDPPGYVDEEWGLSLKDVDIDTTFPLFAKSYHAPEILDFPNGCSTPVHDTWPGEQRSEPRTKTVSTIAPGFGHASLGRGSDANQMQAQLHFSGSHGHAHADCLNLTLWAKEREMLSDIGYTWSRARKWTASSLAHNLVLIDRQAQKGSPSDGDLIWFFPDTGGVSVVEADGRRAYSARDDVESYRRILVTVPVSDIDAYVVDIFRTEGGSIHDWLLHGDADRDMTAACSLPLWLGPENMLEPGEEWVEPRNEREGYNCWGLVRDLLVARTDANWSTTFRYAEEPDRGIVIHMAGGVGSEVFLGRSPSVRRIGSGGAGDSSKAFDYWMPQLVVRRRGDAPLTTTFAAVEEPFYGQPFIDAVEPVSIEPTVDGCVALSVQHGDSLDTIISTLDEPPYPERRTIDGIVLRGKLGIVRREGDRVTGMWLFEGEALSVEGQDALNTAVGCLSGTIESATRKLDGAEEDAFVTSADLPTGQALHGVWMIVTHGNGFAHSYEIDQARREDARSVIVLTHDHGLLITGDVTQEYFYPQRKIEGKNSFRIPLSATTVEAD